MIACPNCGGDSGVIETRSGNDNGWSYCRRRKKCEKCSHKFSTIEIIVVPGITSQEMILVPKQIVEDALKPLVLILASRIGESRAVEFVDQILGKAGPDD